MYLLLKIGCFKVVRERDKTSILMAMSVFYLTSLFSSSIAQNNDKNLILKENIDSSTFRKMEI